MSSFVVAAANRRKTSSEIMYSTLLVKRLEQELFFTIRTKSVKSSLNEKSLENHLVGRFI